jgi:hypothetical protein
MPTSHTATGVVPLYPLDGKRRPGPMTRPGDPLHSVSGRRSCCKFSLKPRPGCAGGSPLFRCHFPLPRWRQAVDCHGLEVSGSSYLVDWPPLFNLGESDNLPALSISTYQPSSQNRLGLHAMASALRSAFQPQFRRKPLEAFGLVSPPSPVATLPSSSGQQQKPMDQED